MRTFNGHQEGLIKIANRGGDIVIDSLQQLNDLLLTNIRTAAFKSAQSRSHNDRCVITIEAVSRQEFTHFHFDKFQHFRVLKSVDLVDKDDDSLDTDLTGEE